MRPLRIRLKPGADPAGAVGVLGSLINDGRNVVASVGGATLIGPGAVPLAEAFVSWVENIELQLSALSFDEDLIDALHTERYWRIRQLHEEPIRPVALVQAEIDRRTRWLTALQQDLQTRLRKAAHAPGVPTVLDTNVLLEFVPPEQVDWHSVVYAPLIRLVIPLRVIEELDALKYDQRRWQRADRVRRLLPQLAGWLASPGGPVELREGITIEMDLLTGPRDRPADGDEEVLQVCQEFEQFGGGSVVLISDDAAIRLRAQALGIRTAQVPDRYSRRRPPDADG
jgi:hypothetical protein